MKLLRRTLLVLLVLFLLVLVVFTYLIRSIAFRHAPWIFPAKEAQVYATQQVPNILLLVAEDMSDRVGAFGDTLAKTPNLDRLASMGVRYPNTFTTAGVCAPSRAALITGMHQISMGGQHMRTGNYPGGGYKAVPPVHVKAFPELLRKAGYFTFNTVKEDYQFSGTLPGSGPPSLWDVENSADLWRDRQEEQPFFGMINFMETHESSLFTPLGHRPNSLVHFIFQYARFVGSIRQSPIQTNPDHVILPPYFPDHSAIRSDIARHYDNIAAMDAIVGDLLDKLEQDGLLENTIIIWTTDHGDALPRAKRELYDSGIKVPMIVYYPEAYRPKGIEVGGIDEQLISFVDLGPTILHFAGKKPEDWMHGRVFPGIDSLERSYIYASRDRIDAVEDRQRAVRNQRFKYIKSWSPNQPGGHKLAFRDNLESMRALWTLKENDQLTTQQLLWFNPPGEERLYDTQTDPFELNDLSRDTAYAKTLEEMRQALNDWLTSIEDFSEMPEAEMVKKFQPDQDPIETPAPTIALMDGTIKITSTAQGASMMYQLNAGPWKLYTQPFPADSTVKFTAKAVRYGWSESKKIHFSF